MELLKDLSKFKDMVLATSYGDKVTARTVSTMVVGNKIYFQTANTMEKYYQISNNNNVALTKGFYQIEGKAKSIGSWDQNPQLCAIYKNIHPSSYNSYGLLPEEEVIEVSITHMKLWTYEEDQVYITSFYPDSNKITKVVQKKV